MLCSYFTEGKCVIIDIVYMLSICLKEAKTRACGKWMRTAALLLITLYQYIAYINKLTGFYRYLQISKPSFTCMLTRQESAICL